MPWRLSLLNGSYTDGGYQENDYQWMDDYSLLPKERIFELVSADWASRGLELTRDRFKELGLKTWITMVDTMVEHVSMPIPEDLLPIHFKQYNDRDAFPDFFLAMGHRMVSNRFITLIEKFEPNTHTFYPVELTASDGRVRSGEMWMIKVGNIVDGGINVAESDVREILSDGKVAHYLQTMIPPLIMWHKEKIEGLHLWVDPLHSQSITVSDALYSEMAALKMTGFQAQESRAR